MVTVGMYYDVIPDKASLFTAKFREVIDVLSTIPGHKATYLYQRVDDPNSFAVMSEWTDQDAFMTFIRSETFRSVTSWALAPVTDEARGMPLASVIRWCFVPGLARSTGLGPVAPPP